MWQEPIAIAAWDPDQQFMFPASWSRILLFPAPGSR